MPHRPASKCSPSLAPDALEGSDQDCREPLVSANRSRGALRADLADEARAKARLHALSAKLGSVIRDPEDMGDVMLGRIDESERQSGLWLVEMVHRLGQQATRWRAVKAKAAELAREPVEAETPASQLGSCEAVAWGGLRLGWPEQFRRQQTVTAPMQRRFMAADPVRSGVEA